MRLRLYESAITSRSVFLRKICGPATFEFCNKIGQKRMWTRRAIALTLVGDHSGEDPVRTAVAGPAAVALVFWCIASFLVTDALAASLEAVEFEGASKPLTRGDRIQGLCESSIRTASNRRRHQ